MSALVDALQKGQVTGDCTLAAVLDGPEVGSRMLLRGGCPVWQTHSSGVLQRSLSRLQECTATGFLELDGTRVFAERFGAVPQIVVCGGGHVAVSVVRLAKLLGLPVLAMEHGICAGPAGCRCGHGPLLTVCTGTGAGARRGRDLLCGRDPRPCL